MTQQPHSPLVLSAGDREQIAEVDRLARDTSSVPALVERLKTRSWAVRRAVVAALARAGQAAIEPLVQVLFGARDDEALLAAAVDALCASRGDADAAMLRLAAVDPPTPLLCDAAQVLGRRKSVKGIATLERLATHADDNLAVAAIEALGRIGGGAGTGALVAVLESRNFFRIFPAIDVMGRSGDPRVLEPLVRLLDDPRYALEAARALGRTGEAAAAGPLGALLHRANDSLARVIAASLGAIHASALSRFGTAAAVENAVFTTRDPVALVQRLAQSVAGASPEEQTALCSVLSWIKDETAAATLISLLDATPGAATAALRALGRDRDPQLLGALRDGDSVRRTLLLPLISARTRSAADILPCLDDGDSGVRLLACSALARIGDVAAVPRLFEVLRGPDPMLSQAAVAAIQALGSADTERLALEAARAPEPHVRRAALRVVASFGYPAGLDLLIEAVEGTDDRLRDAAIHGLALMENPRALQALLRTAGHQNPRARAAAARGLGQSQNGAEVAAALHRGLRDPDAWVRYYACQSLGKLGDETAVDEMLRLLADPAGQVRVVAVEALAHLGAPRAAEALKTAARAEDPDVQRAALLGLGARNIPGALPVLLAAATSVDAATRLIALSAIAPYPDGSVVAALEAAAGDAETTVRDAAIGFLSGRDDAAATAALISLLGNPLLRERAIEALATPVRSRVAGLLAALETADHELSNGLVAALARMRRHDATVAILDALGFANVFARRAAASALGALRTPDAHAALERAVDADSDEEVRKTCLAALRP